MLGLNARYPSASLSSIQGVSAQEAEASPVADGEVAFPIGEAVSEDGAPIDELFEEVPEEIVEEESSATAAPDAEDQAGVSQGDTTGDVPTSQEDGGDAEGSSPVSDVTEQTVEVIDVEAEGLIVAAPAGAAPVARDVDLGCRIDPGTPSIRRLRVIAEDVGVGAPTITYTLFELDETTPVADQPAPTNNVFTNSFTGAFGRLDITAVYPDAVTVRGSVRCNVPEPEPTATNTPEPTATNTPEPTATNTPEPTATSTAIPTATNTSVPTATNTPESTATSTATTTRTATATNTPQATSTNTPVATIEVPATETATSTPLPTATNTPEPTATSTPEPTATNTPEPTATNTPEPTATNTPEPTETNTPQPTETVAGVSETEVPENATRTAEAEATSTPAIGATATVPSATTPAGGPTVTTLPSTGFQAGEPSGTGGTQTALLLLVSALIAGTIYGRRRISRIS